MSSAENFDSTPAKSKAAPPEVRSTKPVVDPATLLHREIRTDEFWRRIPAFADVEAETFNDYKWQMKSSLYGEDKLMELMDGLAPQEFIDDAYQGFRKAPMSVRVTPYLFSLIDWDNPFDDPIRTQFISLGSRLI